MGLRALLAEARDVVVVGEAADTATALDVVRAQAPDLVVTDLDLADGSGIALALAVRELAPATRVVALSSTANEVSVRQAAVAGIGGYLLKSRPSREILTALIDVLAGRPVDPPAALEASPTGADVPSAARAAVLERLSPRERQIFDLIIWGQTNKQVAVKLGISVKTVETHRSHINGKLQVHSAAELVRLASLCGALAAGNEGPLDAASLSTARVSRDKSPGKIAVERSSVPRLVAKIG
jgi:two-component system nitrate/nitrite response regulator NarL